MMDTESVLRVPDSVGTNCANSSFAPLGLELFSALHPRLTAWAAFFRGFAAKIRCSTSKARVHISQIVDIWGGPSFCWAADGGCPYESPQL